MTSCRPRFSCASSSAGGCTPQRAGGSNGRDIYGVRPAARHEKRGVTGVIIFPSGIYPLAGHLRIQAAPASYGRHRSAGCSPKLLGLAPRPRRSTCHSSDRPRELLIGTPCQGTARPQAAISGMNVSIALPSEKRYGGGRAPFSGSAVYRPLPGNFFAQSISTWESVAE